MSYEKDLAEGKKYEDYISTTLGIRVYQEEYEQYNLGESPIGIEIKNDKRMNETGNIFIETAEKRRAENPRWIPSGILRDNGDWGYLIGNEREAYLFTKERLKEIMKNKSIMTIAAQTSQGFLITIEEAQKYAIKKYKF